MQWQIYINNKKEGAKYSLFSLYRNLYMPLFFEVFYSSVYASSFELTNVSLSKPGRVFPSLTNCD